MKSTTNVRRVVLSIIGVFIAVAVVAGDISVEAASTKPGITVQVSPASQSITSGTTAVYAVTLTSTGGFTGSVVLKAAGLPSGSTADFPANPVNLNGTTTSVLSVVAAANTKAGSYTLTVTGTSGKVSGSVTAGLTVNASPSPGVLTMTATPASVTLAPGETAAYTIQLVRTNLPGNVTLSVISGLPTGASALFAPEVTSASTSTLQVATTETLRDDTYTLVLRASDGAPVPKTATASVKMVVITKGKAFTISGNLSDLLAPGAELPLELSLTNPNKKSISVTNLSVTLKSVAPASDAVGSCTLSDYAVVQYIGPYPLVVPGSSTKTLTQLYIDDRQKPQIKFLDTSLNQDGCKGATLQLSYSGSAQGN